MVTTTNTDFTLNTATTRGGAIAAATTTITGGTFDRNTAPTGGAVADAAGTAGAVNATDALFVDNEATAAGTINGRGGALLVGSGGVEHTRFESNEATGPRWSDRPRLERRRLRHVQRHRLAVRGQQRPSRRCGLRGVIGHRAGLHPHRPLQHDVGGELGHVGRGRCGRLQRERRHATLAGNIAPQGANVYAALLFASEASVVSDPAGGGSNCGFDANPGGGGFADTTSFDSDGSCGFLAGNDLGPGDAALGPLRDNGGPTRTLYPLAGSPLVDGVANGDCHGTLVTDQRGVDRPFPTGGACDIGAIEQTYPPHAFSDVPKWVEDAVRWMTSDVNDPALMTGFNNGTFRPDIDITRAQVVRQVYRLMGAPDVSGLPAHAFTDVPAWVDDAVTWAAHDPDGAGPVQPIITGITPTTFVPNDPITRAQTVRMMYRAVGAPDVAGLPAHPFTDVPNWVQDAVTWAANTDNPLPLVTGITPTTFVPNDPISRAQVVRLAYRLALTPDAWADPVNAPDTVPFRPTA